MITKKLVNGKELITSCTIANCCLSVEHSDKEKGTIKLHNEHGQELICTLSELSEIATYLFAKEGII